MIVIKDDNLKREMTAMMGKLANYWRFSYRHMVPVVLAFVVAMSLPPFSLFEDRAAGMLQSHLLLELFAVIVAILIAVISWQDLNHRQNPDSGILLGGFTLVAMLDLIHALVYDGMPRLVIDNSTLRSVFFWLAGRTVVALTLLALVLQWRIFLPRRVWLLGALLVGGLVFWLGTYHLDAFPVTFIPGQGVTPFKARYEYTLMVSYLVLALLFIQRAPKDQPQRFFAIASSCVVMALGEVVFSNYRSTSDFLNNFGHLFKVMSYAFLYRNVFVTAIQQPYTRVRESEERFRALTELSADSYWEQDANFRFVAVSSMPYDRDTESRVLGHTRWDLSTQGVSAQQWQEHRETLARHEPFKDFVYRVEVHPGVFRWLSSSGMPFFDEQGRFLGYRGVMTDITARKEDEQQIEFLAYHDALTGLPNRLLLQDRFEQALSHATRGGHKVGLVFLDVDHFKGINDTLGHAVGDALLKQLAQRLTESVRATDTVCRQGGDEFLILLSEFAQVDDMVPVLAKLMECVQTPLQFEDQEISSTASIGVAVYPEDGLDFETLRRKADMAMYRAKESGRNAYRFFDEVMHTEAAENLALRNGLRRALEQNELLLHYQPQMDLASGHVIGVEALLRWHHPALGVVPPARFIPVAEESGLIVPIGEWVLREACRQAVAWQRAGLPPLVMAVNLSAVQFKRGNIEQSVRDALELTGLPADRLELELTESILIQNADSVLATLQRLKQLGVQLSIDDFGTGYSSLSYLKRFDIDKLKIDQSFVRDLMTDPEDAAIVQAIIQMARSLQLRTIAEGVETADVLAQLRALGCDEGQGYFFARPLAPEAMAHFLQDPP